MKKLKLKLSLSALLFLLTGLVMPVLPVSATHLPEPLTYFRTQGEIQVEFPGDTTNRPPNETFTRDGDTDTFLGQGIGGCVSEIRNVSLDESTGEVSGTYVFVAQFDDNHEFTGECDEHQSIPISVNDAETGFPEAGEGEEEEAEITCQGQSGELGWLACPVTNFLIETAEYVSGILDSLLHVRPLVANEADPAFRIWSNVRDIGLLLLVIATLGLIFSEALSLNVSQLTVKRMLPRLVTAAIGVVLSFYLVAAAVDLFNVLGGGIQSLMFSALGEDGISTDWGETVTQWIVGLGAILGAGAALISLGVIGFMTFILLPVVLGLLITLFTIVARQVIIVALAVFAPVALAAWVLPNTERYFKQWWDLLIKALFMYPLIMILLASGVIFGSILTNQSTGTNTGFLNYLLAMVAIALPLFLVPATFKAAGGIVGRIAGFAGDRSRGPIDRMRNAGKERTEQRHAFRQNEARAKMGQGDNKFRTRMRAGAIFRGGKDWKTGKDSLRKRLADAELTTGAMPAEQKIEFLEAKARKDAVDAEMFGINQELSKVEPRDYNTHLRQAFSAPGVTEAKQRAIFGKLAELRGDAELQDIMGELGQQGNADYARDLQSSNFPNIDSWSPQTSRGSISASGFTPTYSAIVDRSAGDTAKVKPTGISSYIQDSVNRNDHESFQTLLRSIDQARIEDVPTETQRIIKRVLVDSQDAVPGANQLLNRVDRSVVSSLETKLAATPPTTGGGGPGTGGTSPPPSGGGPSGGPGTPPSPPAPSSPGGGIAGPGPAGPPPPSGGGSVSGGGSSSPSASSSVVPPPAPGAIPLSGSQSEPTKPKQPSSSPSPIPEREDN